MPLILKLPAFGLGIVFLWWVLWGKTGIGKAKEASSGSNSPSTIGPVSGGMVQQNYGQIGVQNNAPVQTQFNAPASQTTIQNSVVIVIGGPLTKDHFAPAEGSEIDGTSYSLAQLKRAFPLGFVIFRKLGEKEWEYTPDTKDVWDWKTPPTIKIVPDFGKRTVTWDFINFSGVSQTHPLVISNATIKGMHFPMTVGRVYPWKLLYVTNRPCVYVVTLSDNPAHFVAAFGVQIFSSDADFQL